MRAHRANKGWPDNIESVRAHLMPAATAPESVAGQSQFEMRSAGVARHQMRRFGDLARHMRLRGEHSAGTLNQSPDNSSPWPPRGITPTGTGIRLSGTAGGGALGPYGRATCSLRAPTAPGASDFSIAALIALSCGSKALAAGFRSPYCRVVADGAVCPSSQARIASRITADALRS